MLSSKIAGGLFGKNLRTLELYRSFAAGIAPIASLGKKKKLGKLGPVLEKKVLPVETDPNKLVKFVCGSNILREDGQDVELKPDNEYPEWLWNLQTGRPKRLEELDPDTPQYWMKVRKMARVKNNLMSKLKKF